MISLRLRKWGWSISNCYCIFNLLCNKLNIAKNLFKDLTVGPLIGAKSNIRVDIMKYYEIYSVSFPPSFMHQYLRRLILEFNIYTVGYMSKSNTIFTLDSMSKKRWIQFKLYTVVSMPKIRYKHSTSYTPWD